MTANVRTKRIFTFPDMAAIMAEQSHRDKVFAAECGFWLRVQPMGNTGLAKVYAYLGRSR